MRFCSLDTPRTSYAIHPRFVESGCWETLNGRARLSGHSFEDTDAIRRAIMETRNLTNRPFGVNLILNWPQEERLEAC